MSQGQITDTGGQPGTDDALLARSQGFRGLSPFSRAMTCHPAMRSTSPITSSKSDGLMWSVDRSGYGAEQIQHLLRAALATANRAQEDA